MSEPARGEPGRPTRYRDLRREPPEETTEYPGLVVNDGRAFAALAIGPTRQTFWCLAGFLARGGWPAVLELWPDLEQPPYSWSEPQMALFLESLLDQRGEFARLLGVLADAERRDAERGRAGAATPWYQRRTQRTRVAGALRRCLAALEAEGECGTGGRTVEGGAP